MIEFDAVSKTYPDGTRAVDEFSLTIPAHTTVAFLGSSGSGKTTLLRMVNRMVEPSSGRVLIDGEDVAHRNPVELRRSIGYVLQAGGLLPHRTVLDNVATVLRLNGQSRSEARETALVALATVGLDPDAADRYPGELSGGQQQRVGVARALAPDPNVLLMDEPFGAVDPIVRRDLQDELLRLQAPLGKTIIFVTHDVDEAFRVGDRVVLLQEHGVIAQEGKPEELVANPSSPFVSSFLGSSLSSRQLHTREIGGHLVALDTDERPVGVISQ